MLTWFITSINVCFVMKAATVERVKTIMTFIRKTIHLRIRGCKDEPETVKDVTGYGFEACFSNGHIHYIGVYKNEAKDALHKTNWIVTDVHTGYAICEGHTRRDAVETFQRVYCSKLERMVFSNEHYPHGDSFTNWYEYKSDEFKKMVEGAI